MRVLSATFIIGLSACRVRSTEILKDLLFHTERLEKQRLIKDSIFVKQSLQAFSSGLNVHYTVLLKWGLHVCLLVY